MSKVPGDLYIKYDASDDGSSAIPGGAVFWASPSIWLADDEGDTLPYAKVGVPTSIMVQVNSTSTTPRTQVKVQTWVCDYTPGHIGPDTALSSSGGPNGRTKTVSTAVSKAGPGTVAIPWTPKAADLINGPDPDHGHVCVGANVYVEFVPTEEAPPPEGGRLSSGTLDVMKNRHHGWKNITVVRNGPQFRPMVFRLTNPGPEPATFGVRAWEVDGDAPLSDVEQEHLLATHFVDLVEGAPKPPPQNPACLREPRERTWLAEGGRLVLLGVPDQVSLRRADRRADFVLRTAEGAFESGTVRVEPGQRVPVALTVTSRGEPGEVHTFDIVRHTEDGTIVGGARLITVDVPDWHL
ncbi:hypothetical protein LO762_08375 [Actinocorallia sp. API 0066]|uniref:hypothetical protein n=1 Tax=Actinocorallia sp. API 0066 TaxID=2896846 RepID=UPI001E48E352|nr:hypothetical protein [Actinocorallia sp. API 0066]MCD0449202.1 hypothetical protein [Actinocorallia sp. API 0066]